VFVEGGVDVVKVSIKLANGKSKVRRYRSTDPVRVLYAVAADGVGNTGEGRAFELSTTFPKVSLSDRLDDSIGTVGLGGSQVVMQWL
jgi:hypothetical protein